MFVWSKILGFFALPTNLLFSAALLGILLMLTRLRRFGQGLLVGSVLLLVVIGVAPVGNALMYPLEARFPQWQSAGPAPDGIIILGGAISPDVSVQRGQPALNEAAERMTVVAKLARQFPNARIVFSGGRGRLTAGAKEADVAAELFETFGIPRERITLEDRSRNTVENAVFSRRLVQPKPTERWLLVTSAHHMPRSIGIFRQAGFPVEAYPVDFRTRGIGDLKVFTEVISAGLARTDAAAREWIGMLTYWLLGQSSELFPGPKPGLSGK